MHCFLFVLEILNVPFVGSFVFIVIRKSSSFLASIMPESVSDVLDPAHHHVLHNAVPVGIRRLSNFFS